MDLASAFATIVGLLAEFSNHRRIRSDQDYADFIAWLSESRHAEVVQLLEQNAVTATSIKALLNQDRSELNRKLERLDRILAALASNIDGLQQLAETVHPSARISDQALRILREMDASGAGKALDIRTSTSRGLMLMDGGGGSVSFTDHRFADDDMATLVELGLLRMTYNSRGESVYIFTRYAADYIKTLAGGA